VNNVCRAVATCVLRKRDRLREPEDIPGVILVLHSLQPRQVTPEILALPLTRRQRRVDIVRIGVHDGVLKVGDQIVHEGDAVLSTGSRCREGGGTGGTVELEVEDVVTVGVGGRCGGDRGDVSSVHVDLNPPAQRSTTPTVLKHPTNPTGVVQRRGDR